MKGHAQSSICGSASSLSNIIEETNSQEKLDTKSRLENLIGVKSLVFAGEVHFHTNTKYLSELIKMFAQIKGKTACVAFEFAKRDHQFNVYLDKISQAIQALEQELLSNELDEESNLQFQEAVKAYSQLKEYYLPLNEAALNAGLKAFAVDHKDHGFTGEASYSDRNKAMAANLEELITTKKCSSILYFVGKAHLSTSLGTTDKVQDYISPELLEKSITMNIQMTNEASLPFAGRTWAGCKAHTPNKPVIFRSDIFENNISIMPFVREEMPLLIDYEFTYLLPSE